MVKAGVSERQLVKLMAECLNTLSVKKLQSHVLNKTWIPPHFVNMMRELEHVPSFVMGKGGMYACGLKLDDALAEGGMLTDSSQAMQEMVGDLVQEWMLSATEEEE